ncbi:MAG: 50S ribosomal protein L18 [Elusimicrobiota bacterium]|jgi:large subunit ribosomal protein L18|nr:50S ribosomal protein L18 [Elusimicrobiota bacterium]
MKNSRERFDYRVKRVRAKIRGNQERPRLSVYRGNKHIYAQIIDDDKGVTLASASTLSNESKTKLKTTNGVVAAQFVGDQIAKKAVEKGIKKVVFDRRGYAYIGKVKALADAARSGGLEF